MEEIISNPQIKTPKNKNVGIWIMLCALIVALGVIGWFVWMMLGWNTERAALQADKLALQEEIKSLNTQLNLAGSATDDTPACSPTVSDTFKANIRAAVESHNYAALEPSMNATVRVILAASEGVGDRTPAQAVADMAYLNQGTTPWNFSLPAATITAWEAGFYTDYFDDNTYVGRATNGMVVVFDFDTCGKINEVFMVAHEELLL